jgi:HEAT repeat protein
MVHIENTPNRRTDQSDAATPASIEALLTDLGNHDGLTRQQARIKLVRIGEPAVEALIRALKIPNEYVHWEAAKALSQIGSPRSTQALVEALKDDQFSIRWLAAEGLITIGQNSLKPLLQALMQDPKSKRLREGAHHVLYDLVHQGLLSPAERSQVMPVLTALNDVEPAVAVPRAVHQALQKLR